MHEPLHNIISHQDKNSLDYREKALMEKLNSKAMHKFSFWYYRKSVFSTFFTNFHSMQWILLNLENTTSPVPPFSWSLSLLSPGPHSCGVWIHCSPCSGTGQVSYVGEGGAWLRQPEVTGTKKCYSLDSHSTLEPVKGILFLLYSFSARRSLLSSDLLRDEQHRPCGMKRKAQIWEKYALQYNFRQIHKN